ncbi:MAG: glycosyltransferase family 4 protein [Candidatus Micrarchaeota archaeon]
MKVCFVNALFYPFRGGTETHMLELGEALVKQGVEVHVVTARLKGTKQEETVNGISVHRIPAEVIRIEGLYPPPLVICRNFLKHLRQTDARENFDVFHLHGRWFPDFTQVRKHCSDVGKPLVLTIHNARPTGISALYTLFGSMYENAVGKSVIKGAGSLIAVSKWTAEDIAKYHIPKKKFTVIYDGIDATKFSPAFNPKVKEELGIHPKSPLLVWVGRIIPQKGLKYLIAAMPAILKNSPTTKLLIIGTGTELPELKKQAAKLGVANSIIFYGQVNDRKKLNNLLRGCDLFVFPSIWEPFGMVITEAMASGLPIVAARTGGIPEIIQENKNGLLVKPRSAKAFATAVVKILNSGKLKQMGANGRKVVEKKFNWAAIAKQTIAVYKKAPVTKEEGIPQMALNEMHEVFEKGIETISAKKLTKYTIRLKRLLKRLS